MKIIVIGSGMVGASAAYYLAKKNGEVILIDKEHVGNATAAGAGIVCPWISNVKDKNWYDIAKEGARFYTSLISQLAKDGESDHGYKKVGAISVSSQIEELDVIEENLKEKLKDTPEIGEVKRLSSKETKELFPPLNDDLDGVFVSGAARVDGRLLSNAMRKAAVKNGATFIQGEAELIFDQGEVEGVIVNGESIYADSVVVTAGAWAPELLKPLGVSFQVEPQRGQIAHIKLPDEDTSNWPVILPQGSHYMLAFDDSRVVAGATRETGVGFDYRKTAGGIQGVISEALKVAPGLDDGTLHEVRIGFRPMGPDILPLIGKIDHVKGIVLANGLGASGITMGAYVGKLAASIANEEEITKHDMTAYSPMRAITLND